MKKFGDYIEESLAAEIKNEPKSEAAKQAKRMGLRYAGFGRYIDQKGKVAYIVDKGKLVPFKGEEEIHSLWNKAEDIDFFSSDKKDKDKHKDKYKEAEKAAKQAEDVYVRRKKDDEKLQQKIENDSYKVNNALIKHFDKHVFNKLNAFQAETLQHYTEDGYGPINRYLYKGHDEGADITTDRKIAGQVAALDSILDQSVAPFSYTTYTGLSNRYSPEKIKPGEKYIFRGYISASLSPTTAIDGFTDIEAKNRVVLQVEVRGGQKALHVDSFSSNGGEMETILPRGSMVHVVSGPHIVKPEALGLSGGWDGDGGKDVHLFHCLLVQDEDEDE